MKLHYMGKYNLDPSSLPHGEHMPGAVKFREAESTGKLALIANALSLIITAALLGLAIFRSFPYLPGSAWQIIVGAAAAMLSMFPHEFLHAVCFREDAYIYTNFAQGLLFVVGPETMSRRRFIFMSLLPNIVFGIVPFIIGMIFPHLLFFSALGACAAGMGAGDYYNVFNAATQMPKGAKTYLYGFNSYWYMPEK